jgi:diaminopimelate decarboxylase
MPGQLRPLLDPALAGLLQASPHALRDWIEHYGSPLNVVFPDRLKQNVEAFRTVLQRHGVGYALFYGAKVNKSPGLVRAAVEAGIGVDVSSLYEMRDALLAGAKPERLCATGPAKTRAFHTTLIDNGALISVDSVAELDDLEHLARQMAPRQPVRVLLRYRPESAAASRFGMGADDLLACLRRLAGQRAVFAFEGFHFHLGGYGVESRAQAVREVARFIDAARSLGLAPRMLDIGGGLPIRYVEADAYEAFLRAQTGADYRNGTVPTSLYPYGGRIDACTWLERFLSAPCVDGLSVASYLKANDLTLAIEPGRSLADQTAISLFRVTRVKPLASGDHVVFVEGSSFSACETWFASEYLVDPIVVPAPHSNMRANVGAMPMRAYLAGHSCLDDDVLTNRLIDFPHGVRAGDLLVYANTAGYQMDLLENQFHRHPMPRRIAVAFLATGGMTVSPDDRLESTT